MSLELIGILGVGATLFVGLGGLMVAGWTMIDRRLAEVDLRVAHVEGSLKRVEELLLRPGP